MVTLRQAGIAQSARPSRKERLAEREAELLPVPYYHLSFTLPAAIGDIAYHSKAVIYGLLFKAAPRRSSPSPPTRSTSACGSV